MKKIFVFLFTLIALQSQAQQDSAKTEKVRKIDPDRLVFGGSFGASFGNFTFVQMTPQVGYRITNRFTAGAGVNFVYSSIKYFTSPEYRSNSGYAGLNIFGRVFPVNFLMVSAQPEMNYSWGKINYTSNSYPDIKLDGKMVPSLLLGAGIVVPSGGRGGIIVSMQYDVIQHERSPYGTKPFVNIGFNF